MAPKNNRARPTVVAIKTRDRPFRRNPTIWPQPPTKPPKYRRNNYNPVRMQVCALSEGKISACKRLILSCLRERLENGRGELFRRDTSYCEKFEPKESIIFVPLELPTIGTVSARKRQMSQSETVSPRKLSPISRFTTYSFGLGGGSSRATTGSLKPEVLCEPSQNGLLAEWPQRQRPIEVRPARPKAWPSGSTISNSPSTRIDPLLLMVILAAAIQAS